MDVSTPVTQQRQKENRLLQIFVTSSLLTSVAVHGIIMGFPVPTLRGDRTNPEKDPQEIEVLITEVAAEAPQTAVLEDIPLDSPEPDLTEPDLTELNSPEPDLTEPDLVESEAVEPELKEPELKEPELAEPVRAVALTPALLPQPGPEASAPIATDDPITDPTLGAGTQETGIDDGEGNLDVGNPTPGFVTPAEGTGTGLGLRDSNSSLGNGNSSQSGNKLRGTESGGTAPGQARGTPDNRATQPASPASRSPRSVSSNSLRCLKCPQPEYQGTEASSRVELRVRPDGSVDVQLRESSGNAALDRRTLEVMSQWQFDPETVPEGGVLRRVRVTYEAQGSRFQRENERRRQAEAQRQQAQQQEESPAAQEPAAQHQQDRDRLTQETPPAVSQDPPDVPSADPPAMPPIQPSAPQETPEVPQVTPPSDPSTTSEESPIDLGSSSIPTEASEPIEESSPQPEPVDTPMTLPPAPEPLEATEIPASDPESPSP